MTSHRELREAKYAAFKEKVRAAEIRKIENTGNGKVGKRKRKFVVAGPEATRGAKSNDQDLRRPRPARADQRIAELRAELEANRSARRASEMIDEMNEPESNEPDETDDEELETDEHEAPPEPRKRVRIAEPFRLPSREQIAALCLDAYRIALDHKRIDKEGNEIPAPLVAPAVMALRALTDVCGYAQMKRTTITDQEYEDVKSSVSAEEALEKMRSNKAVAEQPKPRF